MPRAARAFPQLPDPVPGVTGKVRELARLLTQFHSTRACFSCRSEDSTADHAERRPAAQGRDLPAATMRIAERIGEHRAQALARQEKSSGRWSQTLENLNAINRVVDMPVLRPLIGWTRKR